MQVVCQPFLADDVECSDVSERQIAWQTLYVGHAQVGSNWSFVKMPSLMMRSTILSIRYNTGDCVTLDLI